jgi:hypothetical protein
MLPAGGATSRGAGVAVVMDLRHEFEKRRTVGELKLTRVPKAVGQGSQPSLYNIRQYMSYEIIACASMKTHTIRAAYSLYRLLPLHFNFCLTTLKNEASGSDASGSVFFALRMVTTDSRSTCIGLRPSNVRNTG